MPYRHTCLLLTLLSCALGVQAQVYRCPGPPVLYTDALSPKEAQEKGCRSIEGTPITVLQSPKPRAAAPAPAPGATPAAAPTASRGGNEGRVDPTQQKGRDDERRRVLESELREAEARLAELQREYQGGQPDRRGDERNNYQKYLDRVAELKAGITRQEADIQALKREISKLP